jgi:hypothetical protein
VERIGNNNGRRPRRMGDGVGERKHGGAIIASGWKKACGSNMYDFRTETVAERNHACLPIAHSMSIQNFDSISHVD